MSSFISIPKREKGQGFVKYAIVLALVAMVVIVGMRVLGPRVGDGFGPVNSSLADATGGNVIVGGNFQSDDLYWNTPVNGCKVDYVYGTNPGCDNIVDRVKACLAGSTGPYCDDYFAVYPQ